jgi:hypothetical protein
VRYHCSGRSPIVDIVAQAPCADKSRGGATSGQARYIAAVRSLVAGDPCKHRLLIGMSGCIAAYAQGLRRAMEDAA